MRFYAVNAGYKDEKSAQNYDFIEFERLSYSDLSLAPYRITYTNSAGNLAGEIAFADNLVLTTDHLVLKADVSSPSIAEENSPYLYNFGSSGLASTAGKLELYQGEHKIDEICWGKIECTEKYAKFATKEEENYSLVRCVGLCTDDRTYNLAKYYPDININSIIEVSPQQDDDVGLEEDCEGVIITELYSNYDNNISEQFIELYNPNVEPISLHGCFLEYKNNNYPLDGELKAGEYYIFQNQNLKLTKDPSDSNTVTIINRNRDIKAQLEYPHGQKKGTSYALFDIASTKPFWRQTYHRTPGEGNIYQEFQTCPNGKTVNPKTGNCIKEDNAKIEPTTCPTGKYLDPLTNRCKNIEAATILTPCKEGYERNPETNRCRKVTSASTELTPCKEGYERNPETNRCRKVTNTSAELTPCKEGYERNPKTNRCRKIRENAGEATAYAPEPASEQQYQNPKIFIASAAVIVAIITGIGYIIYQYRGEIRKFLRNLCLRIRKV